MATIWLHRWMRPIKIVVIQGVTETSSSSVRTANLMAKVMRFFRSCNEWGRLSFALWLMKWILYCCSIIFMNLFYKYLRIITIFWKENILVGNTRVLKAFVNVLSIRKLWISIGSRPFSNVSKWRVLIGNGVWNGADGMLSWLLSACKLIEIAVHDDACDAK